MAKEKIPAEELPVEASAAPGEMEPEEKLEMEEMSQEAVLESIKKRMQQYELHRSYVYKQVKSMTFGLMSPKLIKKLSAAKVVTPELYDKEGYPVDGGLMDIRLGVIDPGLRCKTDGSRLKECMGFFGYIELARPIIHILFATKVHELLRGSCRECGNVLVTKQKAGKIRKQLDEVEAQHGMEARRDQLKKIKLSLKSCMKCPHCTAKQYDVKLEKPTTFVENGKRISPIEIRTRLEKISEDDSWLFGLNPSVARPEWMVLTLLAIPPVTMRPSITLESGERSEDDLTHKLGDIVRINQRLFENINAGAPEIIIEDLWDLLQYHTTTYFDNGVAQLPPARHRSGQPLKTLSERIKSKEGRIRHNLAGKRTNFCARTVISPDPRLAINEVGVPKVVAMKLTVPEMVTEWNMEYLKTFVENGPKKYPGSNYVVRPDGKKKKITDETKEASLEELQPGYVVERHLMDGDIAIFNRQPSLHRMSMMCHKIRVLPYKTLRLNPSVCKPYNADFDGDEMNLHIPQTIEARAEAEVLMQVQTQMISPGYGLSAIGCVDDAISGNYLLSKYLKIPRQDAIEILISVGVDEFSRLPDTPIIEGKDVFSLVLPKDFNFKGKDKAGNAITIKKGMLLEGELSKSLLGGGAGHLLRSIHKRYGADETVIILQKIFRLGVEVLGFHGLSASTSDIDLPDKINNMIASTIKEIEDESADLKSQFESAEMEVLPGRSAGETFELKTLEILNRARNRCGKIVQEHIDKSKDMVLITESGARGGLLNLVQISALVGQQALRGKRIEHGYFNRTLSHFKRGDMSPKAHGFVRNGYRHGLAPHEFFFVSMTGRDSMMDTALRTPKSGYLYRRLANALQDVKTEYDGTVRDAAGRIIQFKYGEDGVDVSKSENGKINVTRVVENL